MFPYLVYPGLEDLSSIENSPSLQPTLSNSEAINAKAHAEEKDKFSAAGGSSTNRNNNNAKKTISSSEQQVEKSHFARLVKMSNEKRQASGNFGFNQERQKQGTFFHVAATKSGAWLKFVLYNGDVGWNPSYCSELSGTNIRNRMIHGPYYANNKQQKHYALLDH